MTQEKLIQAREINAIQQRESRTRRAQRFVGTAVGELEVIQEQVHHHQLPQIEDIRFAKLLNKNMKQQRIADVAGKLCLHRHMIFAKS
jgi:hypothetical protein